MHMIEALIFDFDGLILDTETPAFQSWRDLYAEHGHELSLDQWQAALGRGIGHGFDALGHLATLVGESFDRAAIFERRQALKHALCEHLDLLPGVIDLLGQARERGLPCAVASSSGFEWVDGWLRRHGIREAFTVLRTADDVEHTKPAPDLYLSAAAALQLNPAACLVFEDSPNGIHAAHAAGMSCVAVPCELTARLALPPTDLVLPSLAAMSLDQILASVEQRRRRSGVDSSAQPTRS